MKLNKIKVAEEKLLKKHTNMDLANMYILNCGTLRNISSKEGWIKGKNVAPLQEAIVQDDIENRLKRRRKVVNRFDTLLSSHLAFMIEKLEAGENPVSLYEDNTNEIPVTFVKNRVSNV